MSQLGQSRRSKPGSTTSGLPSTTDLGEMRELVRLVPQAAIMYLEFRRVA